MYLVNVQVFSKMCACIFLVAAGTLVGYKIREPSHDAVNEVRNMHIVLLSLAPLFEEPTPNRIEAGQKATRDLFVSYMNRTVQLHMAASLEQRRDIEKCISYMKHMVTTSAQLQKRAQLSNHEEFRWFLEYADGLKL